MSDSQVKRILALKAEIDDAFREIKSKESVVAKRRCKPEWSGWPTSILTLIGLAPFANR